MIDKHNDEHPIVIASLHRQAPNYTPPKALSNARFHYAFLYFV